MQSIEEAFAFHQIERNFLLKPDHASLIAFGTVFEVYLWKPATLQALRGSLFVRTSTTSCVNRIRNQRCGDKEAASTQMVVK
jgi:hypothetical protein